MISGATHNLSGNLANAGAMYRQNIDERKDQARQAAVQVAANQTKKKNIDAYVRSANSGNNDTSSSSTIIDPYEAYQASMKYSRRTNVLAALEKAGEAGIQSGGVDIVV